MHLPEHGPSTGEGLEVKLAAITAWEIREGGRALELADSRFSSTREWAYGRIWAITKAADELRATVERTPGFAEPDGVFDPEDLERALYGRRRDREIDYLRSKRPPVERGGEGARASEGEGHRQGRPRRAQVQFESLDAAPTAEGEGPARQLPDLSAPDPEAEAIITALRGQVAQLMERLPALWRGVVKGRLEERSYRQIAADLGTTPGYARRAHSLALAELRRGLGIES